jgi:transposase-like protein
MEKDKKKRRVYSAEFKAKTVALAAKRGKPVSRIAEDLGINENMLRRWIQQAGKPAGSGMPLFPGHGQPRDKELARLRKENTALRRANEILKKAAAIFAQTEPR